MSAGGTISFMWDWQSTIFPVALAIPAALEAVSLARYFQENHEAISDKCFEVKELAAQSFTPKGNEKPEEFRNRAIKNVLLVLGYGLGVAAIATFTVVLPFLSFPIYLAIPIAVLGMCSVGEMVVNGRSNIESAKEKFSKLKEKAHDAFIPRKEESREESVRRIGKNLLYTVVALAALGIAAYGVTSVVLYALNMLSSGAIGPWNAYDLLPGTRTALGVFGWYGAVGVAHGALACKKWNDGDKKEAVFHMVSAVLSLAFPLIYHFEANPIRMHHSFLGLALMLAPSQSVRSLGGIITFDAGLNTAFNQIRSSGGGFDFMNIVLEHLTPIVATLSALSGIEFLRKRLLPRKKSMEKEEVVQKKEILYEMKVKECSRLEKLSAYAKSLLWNQKCTPGAVSLPQPLSP